MVVSAQPQESCDGKHQKRQYGDAAEGREVSRQFLYPGWSQRVGQICRIAQHEDDVGVESVAFATDHRFCKLDEPPEQP